MTPEQLEELNRLVAANAMTAAECEEWKQRLQALCDANPKVRKFLQHVDRQMNTGWNSMGGTPTEGETI